jgi:hypothetical protein
MSRERTKRQCATATGELPNYPNSSTNFPNRSWRTILSSLNEQSFLVARRVVCPGELFEQFVLLFG